MSSVSQKHTLEQQLLFACLRVDFDPSGSVTTLLFENPNWPTLINLARQHGVLPFFSQQIKKTRTDLIPKAVWDELTRDFIANTLTNLKLHKELQRVIELLQQSGILAAPFKGPVLAEEAYGDVASRSFSDLDLFIPRNRAKEALDLLLADGYQAQFEIKHDQWQPLQRIQNHLILIREDGLLLEVHWEAFHWFYDLPFDMQWIWEEGGATSSSESLGQKISSEAHLILLCQHGTKHGLQQLKHILDVAMLVQNTKNLNWQEIQNYAREARCVKALGLCLTLAKHYCGATIPSEILNDLVEQEELNRLLEEVEHRLWLPSEEPVIKNWYFIWKVKDNLADRLRFLLLLIFFPRVKDWETFHLPMWLFPLYYLLHPVRVIFKYVLRPLIPGTRDEGRGTRKP